MTSVRYELRSAEQLDALANAPLPLGVPCGAAKRSTHRDLYLDTADDVLRSRGIVCRLRVGMGDSHALSIRFTGEHAEPIRVDSRVRSADPAAALAERTPAARRIQALVEPASLQPRLVQEVDRLTREAQLDFLRRPRFELHYDRITVRRERAGRTFHRFCAHQRRGDGDELRRLADALEREHDLRRLSPDPREQGDLMLRWLRPALASDLEASSDHLQSEVGSAESEPFPMFSPELSLLAFQRRVLALAEDSATPLRERLRFLGIVTSNLDEMYMVRMAELREAAAGDRGERGADGFTPQERLARVESEVSSILDAQSAAAADCLRAAKAVGTHILRWSDLAPAECDALRVRCRDEIYPGLTPLAMTLSPGHPLPHLPHLGLSLAILFRRSATSEPHLAELELPSDVSRLQPIPGRRHDVITIEEVLRANVDLLYPNAQVDGAYLFRVTRGGELDLDEQHADDLLSAVARATERRTHNPAVRVEVERSTPAAVCALILENLHREAQGRSVDDVSVSGVQVVSGLLDLRCLSYLPLPTDPALEYPPLLARSGGGVRSDQSMLDAVREREILVHHPFDDFELTVVRFLREAAADPQVTTIKITLYRVGDPSAIVDALLAAARSGKRVAALVELKARFDEEHNVSWARALEAAGAQVVYGLVGLKVHAKVALVVRREGAKLQRYAHVGTGNYSARSGRQYTDLSLFSASDAVTSDVADLFNALTGTSRPPESLSHGSLVAPNQLLSSVLELIERESRHASEGKFARIAIKVNGLSDPDVVRALYRASQAGVRVELAVRGLCTLRPGVPGLSERIRVISIVGRFLEHSRIYRFENDGAPEFFIGSSDLRPRNLRRRVELLVPVRTPGHQAQLNKILALYSRDATGWELMSDGRYEPLGGSGQSAQRALASALEVVDGVYVAP